MAQLVKNLPAMQGTLPNAGLGRYPGEAKSKGEKERYKHLNAEFHRIARRDKKAFLSDQCKEIEETTKCERLEISSRKLEIPREYLCKDGLDKGQKWYGPNRSRRY